MGTRQTGWLDRNFIQKAHRSQREHHGQQPSVEEEDRGAMGSTPAQRRRSVLEHYSTVGQILGHNYWGGAPGYSPARDRLQTHDHGAE